ncbi:unnamed protein product [Victoria cruziana]
MINRFQKVNEQLEQALSAIPYDKLDISDDVREQAELVNSQFRRAKERAGALHNDFYTDLLFLYDQNDNVDIDHAIMERLTQKLQLLTIQELKDESLALQEMVVTGGDPDNSLERMCRLLRKIKDFVQSRIPETADMVAENNVASCDGDLPSPIIPDDFRCPISWELMKDPVIVATGQTYDRSCIQKWLDSGHETCPKSQQKLPHPILTPNYALRSLITQWCESHGIEPPKRLSANGSADHAVIDALIAKLSSTDMDDQRAAAGELRLLAKRNADNRICIANSGAIPVLVHLLASSSDPRTQEHAVTALLNLSICENNKKLIMANEGAISGIVDVLRKGSMEARENAAATLFSLSVIDSNKVMIGSNAGAIPALVELLREGSHRGKKDASTALFNLCIYQGNKGKAVRAGVVETLMEMVVEGGMVDEAIAIMAVLVSHHEGRAAIGDSTGAINVMVNIISNGSPRNKENAAAVLLALCSGDADRHLSEARDMGAMEPLLELACSGTPRAKRKATALIEHMTRFEEQQLQRQRQIQQEERQCEQQEQRQQQLEQQH